MTILQKILDNYQDDSLITLNGLEDAVIGIDEHQMRLIYSQKKIIFILMEREGWNMDEAEEFFAYNIFPLYVGNHSPIFCLDNFYY